MLKIFHYPSLSLKLHEFTQVIVADLTTQRELVCAGQVHHISHHLGYYEISSRKFVEIYDFPIVILNGGINSIACKLYKSALNCRVLPTLKFAVFD
jgi:hypothetical protein